jgi:hypothetical protein
MIDDDDDGFIFDDMADEDELAVERPFLYVPARPPTSEIVNELEERYRMMGHAPVMFLDQETEDGPYVLGNPKTFAVAMGLPPDTPITEEQADEWRNRESAAGRWPAFEW